MSATFMSAAPTFAAPVGEGANGERLAHYCPLVRLSRLPRVYLVLVLVRLSAGLSDLPAPLETSTSSCPRLLHVVVRRGRRENSVPRGEAANSPAVVEAGRKNEICDGRCVADTGRPIGRQRAFEDEGLSLCLGRGALHR